MQGFFVFMGRPSLYTPELANEICDRLASGRSLNAICKMDDMPDITTVMKWLQKSEQGDERFTGLIEIYLRAREAQADVIFDECLEIADQNNADMTFDRETGEIKVNGDAIQRAKLRIDTRMRMAGKLKPKKYGERIIQDIDAKVEVADVSTAKSKLLGGIIPLAPPSGTNQED